jgi:hypothetical protein
MFIIRKEVYPMILKSMVIKYYWVNQLKSLNDLIYFFLATFLYYFQFYYNNPSPI